MKYLLDTNACIHYLNHLDSPVRRRRNSQAGFQRISIDQ